jgi:hypothetical protein
LNFTFWDVGQYDASTVLALVLESPFADLILGKLVNTSIPKSVGNQIAIQNSNELTFALQLEEYLLEGLLLFYLSAYLFDILGNSYNTLKYLKKYLDKGNAALSCPCFLVLYH